jgi:hypothetical protein
MMRCTTLLSALLLLGFLGACDTSSSDSDGGDAGLITVTLPYSGGGWFRLQVYAEGMDADPEFDTGCLLNEASTFELKLLSPGDNRTILFEAFDASSCAETSRVAIGLRGGVTVSEEEPGRYFIPVYDEGASTALPEALNISSSAAVAMDFCNEGESCDAVVEAVGICRKLPSGDGVKLQHWCVPTCTADAECTGLHVRSTCDTDSGWCMLNHPYPLNMSSARALGHAVQAENGDVVLMGGFTRDGDDRLLASDWSFERFNAATGLFDTMKIHLPDYDGHGLTGVAQIAPGKVAYVGGARSVKLNVSGSGTDLALDFSGLNEDEDNLSGKVLLFNTSDGSGTVTSGAMDPVAVPTVLSHSDGVLLILGGWVDDGGTMVRSGAVNRCTYDADDRVDCTSLTALSTPRAGAAAICLGTDGCEQVLVVGGNGGVGAVAEIIIPGDPSASPVELTSDDLPSTISWPGLCGNALVSGSGASFAVGALDAVALDVISGNLTVTALADESGHGSSLGSSVAQAADGSCYISGGLRASGGLSSSVVHAVDGGLEPAAYELNSGRFGAASAVISSGPLAGSVLIAGGLRLSNDGERAVMVHGAEILRP